jgi:hypothetical protein
MRTLVIAANNNEFQNWRRDNPHVDNPVFVSKPEIMKGYSSEDSKVVYTGTWFNRADRFEIEAEAWGRFDARETA